MTENTVDVPPSAAQAAARAAQPTPPHPPLHGVNVADACCSVVNSLELTTIDEAADRVALVS